MGAELTSSKIRKKHRFDTPLFEKGSILQNVRNIFEKIGPPAGQTFKVPKATPSKTGKVVGVDPLFLINSSGFDYRWLMFYFDFELIFGHVLYLFGCVVFGQL